MSSTAIFILIVLGAAAMAVVGIVAIANGRSDSDGAETAGELDRKAAKADRARREVKAAAATTQVADGQGNTATITLVDPATEYSVDAPLETISAVEYGVTRRKFFNRAIGAVFGLFMLQFALAGLAFFWPKLKGGFGTPVKAGSVESLKAEVIQAGTIVPKAIPSAQAWIVPFDMNLLPGSQYEEFPFLVVGGEEDGVGLMALWHRCVHLGCRVPECIPSQGFECPCHGSKYNAHGEYAAGPAPRNLDRFGVSINAAGELVIDTGTIVQTPRSKAFTIPYPQGPFCVG
ncbi:MAG: ubiquinol-cytochrome c reductase iron-sulfur subunit [Acidimicrobiia bacterium]